MPASDLFLQAVRLQQAGQLAEAEKLFGQVLARDPRHADSLHHLGLIALQAGRPAAALIARAIAIDAKKAPYHNNLGRALEQAGESDAAADAYRRALALKPDYLIACNNLGNILRQMGRLEEAIPCYRRAITLNPGQVDAINKLGLALWHTGKLEDASATFRKAIALNPRDAGLFSNLGNVQRQQKQFGAALESFRKALELAPARAEIRNNLGITLLEQGEVDRAIACLSEVVATDPLYPDAHKNLGNALHRQERFDEAIAAYRKYLALRPDANALGTLLMWMHCLSSHDDADLLKVARDFAAMVERPGAAQSFSNNRDPNRRLRIGYVSADFRTHPVGFFLERVFKSHNPAEVEIFCYSNTDFADAVTARLKPAADHWRVIAGASDEETAAQIRRDGIDILVDLAGHTDGNRMTLFAAKPAPLQVTWMGFSGTTGLSSIDYILADRIVAPPGEEDHFAETVWRLPGCYLCYSPPPFDVAIGPPPALSNGFITFATFNKRNKISTDAIMVWAEILRRVAGSRLYLKNTRLADADGRARTLAAFARHGIAAERLILEAHLPETEALAAYNRVDVALDPFPFGGTTTTAETLWMGVPLVTLKGTRWVGRTSQSILAALGLERWAAADRDDYIEIACRLAADLPGLAEWRAALRQRMEISAFCDGAGFTRGLEEAWRGMWRKWCAAAPDS